MTDGIRNLMRWAHKKPTRSMLLSSVPMVRKSPEARKMARELGVPITKWVRAHKYRVTVKHDHGTKCITTVARNKQVAKDVICRCEGCPPRSILSVERLYK